MSYYTPNFYIPNAHSTPGGVYTLSTDLSGNWPVADTRSEETIGATNTLSLFTLKPDEIPNSSNPHPELYNRLRGLSLAINNDGSRLLMGGHMSSFITGGTGPTSNSLSTLTTSLYASGRCDIYDDAKTEYINLISCHTIVKNSIGTLVAGGVGQISPIMFKTIGLNSWVNSTMNFTNTTPINNIICSSISAGPGTVWVSATRFSNHPLIRSSDDGATWVGVAANNYSLWSQSNCIAYNNIIWLAGGTSSNLSSSVSTSSYPLMYSYNSINWFKISVTIQVGSQNIIFKKCTSLIWNGLMWVGLFTFDNTINNTNIYSLKSNDGMVWFNTDATVLNNATFLTSRKPNAV